MRVVYHASDLAASAGCAYVATMGALHEGHIALMRAAKPLAVPLVVSIFVNPTQFGPQEDLSSYPRPLDDDLAAAEASGVDVVFAPDAGVVYPPGEAIAVPDLSELATRPGLEDTHRPGHFAGVCQVVARLFDLVQPSVAVFGEKDYQQLLVVTEMVRREGTRWPGLRIVGHPTVREANGVAMSSRNAYLNPDEQERAKGLFCALETARQIFAGGVAPASIEETMRIVLAEHTFDIDYAVVRHGDTLEPIETPTRPAQALIAGRMGEVRLIDSMRM